MQPPAQRSSTKIVIMGTSTSSQNRGVLALGTSLAGLCVKTMPGASVTLLLNHHKHEHVRMFLNGREESLRVIPCRLSPRSSPRDHLAGIVLAAALYKFLPLAPLRRAIAARVPWIAALREAHLVGDIRGGDSFSDIYGLSRFIKGFLMAWTALAVHGTMVQFPQTYGPYKHAISRVLARYLLRRSATIIARDRLSQEVAQKLVGPGHQVLLSPDVAFSLTARAPVPPALDPPLDGPVPRDVIGINVNGLMYNGGYTRQNMFGLQLDYAAMLPRLITALLREHTGEIWLVPHTFGKPGSVESDPEASRKVIAALDETSRRRVRLVTEEYDQHQIKGVIGQCAFFIGSRMHSCIAALSQGVPCVGVAYSMKFSGVFDSVGMRDWVVDGRTVDTEAALARILELFRARDQVRSALSQSADAARATLLTIFSELQGAAA